jgi:hypothetical protein
MNQQRLISSDGLMGRNLNTVRIRFLVFWKLIPDCYGFIYGCEVAHCFCLPFIVADENETCHLLYGSLSPMAAFAVTLCAFSIHLIHALRYYPQIGPSIIKSVVILMVNL